MHSIPSAIEQIATDTAAIETNDVLNATIQYDLVRKINTAKDLFWAYIERTVTVGDTVSNAQAGDSAISGKIVYLQRGVTQAERGTVPHIPVDLITGIRNAIQEDAAVVWQRLTRQVLQSTNDAASPSASRSPHALLEPGSRHRVPVLQQR